MSIPHPDNARRQALRGAIKLLVLLGLLALFYAFSRTLISTEDAAAGDEFRLALVELGPGSARQFEWDGRRYLVLHRSAEMQALLEAPDGPKLVDPDSHRSRQPDGARNPYRSVDASYLVVLNYDTALNCPLEIVMPQGPDAQRWSGGLRDTCGGSRYDFAGRVLANQRASRNLVVPNHRLEGGQLIISSD